MSPGQSLMSTVGTSRGSSSGARTRTRVAQGGSRYALKATVLAYSRAALLWTTLRKQLALRCDKGGGLFSSGRAQLCTFAGTF